MEETLNTTAPQPPQPQPLMMNMNMGNGGITTPTPPAPPPTTTPPPMSSAATTMATSAGGTTTTTTTTTQGGSFDLFGSGGTAKKKRGRPRKYDSDGNLRPTYNKNVNVAAITSPATLMASQQQGFTLSPPSCSPSEFFSSSNSNTKRGRGRTTSSASLSPHLFASFGEVFATTAGGDFIPHVVTVHAGEDVAGKIMSFTQKGPRGVCVLSANGAISNVTIRQPCSSGGLLTYEGRFEILSLSGSYTVSESNGMRSRSGGLSVSLAGPDGRVIGGGVAGILTAAGPIQLVVGSFMPNGYKTQKRKYHHREHPAVASPPISGGLDTVTAARPISQANPDGVNFVIPTSQLPEQSHHHQPESVGVTIEKVNLDDATTPHGDAAAAATWSGGSEEFSDQRISPDINVSLPDE